MSDWLKFCEDVYGGYLSVVHLRMDEHGHWNEVRTYPYSGEMWRSLQEHAKTIYHTAFHDTVLIRMYLNIGTCWELRQNKTEETGKE